MKRGFYFILVLFCIHQLNAKTVRFAVDMVTHTISPNGIHLTGDFQAMVGFGPDWDPGTLSMTQVGSSTVYQVFLNLPAFKKYEYRFVNGDQTYEVEFVPEESRVGYDFVDNRWLYVDSLANDTTNVGAILFGGNAPAGKILVRYKVDMSDASGISSNGIRVSSICQYSLSTLSTLTRMYSFVPYVFEIINYVSLTGLNTHEYLFNNGSTAETVPAACAVSGKRNFTPTKDTAIKVVCFSSCNNCLSTSLKENVVSSSLFSVFPNPASGSVKITTDLNGEYTLQLVDLFGHLLKEETLNTKEVNLNVEQLHSGLYLVKLHTGSGVEQSSKLIISN